MRSGARFMPAAEAAAIMRGLRRRGADHLTFIGGEPTLHPDFERLLKIAKLLGFAVQVTTDGSGLADPARAARLLRCIDELCLSVHWDKPELARAVTGTASAYADTEAAFANIAKYGRLRLLMCHAVACRLNLASLRGVAAYVLSKARPDIFMVSQLSPWGRAIAGYRRLATRMPDLLRALRPVRRLVEARGARLLISGVPYCALGSWAGLSNEKDFTPRLVLERGRGDFRGEVLTAKRSDAPPLRRVKLGACARCRLAGRCTGVFGAYAEVFGAGAIKPAGAAAVRALAAKKI